MTRRISLFDNPFLLGFDEFERAIDRVSRSASDSYPPYNIEQVGENDIRISIAVAGFDMDDLNVQLEHNQLIIRGKNNQMMKSVFSSIAVLPHANSNAALCSQMILRSQAPAWITVF